MRKRHKLLVAAAALFAAVFFGCSMMDSESVSSSDSQDESRVITRSLSAVIDNIADYDAAFADTRVIMPGIDDTTYDYYIYGTTVVGNKKLTSDGNPLKLDDTNHGFNPTAGAQNTLGSFKIKDIEAAAWDFTLVAVKTGVTCNSLDEMMSKGYLVAYAYVDLTKGDTGTTFHLVPDGLKGKANVRVNVYLSDKNSTTDKWTLPDDTNVLIGIQNLVTGNDIDPPSGPEAPTGTDPYVYTGDLDPGTYNLVVVFEQTKDAKTIRSYWSDILVVLPQRDFTATVFVPNIIGTAPAAPEKLVAWYVENSMDNAGHEGFYKAHFTWDGSKSVNERYFEFQLLDVSALTDKSKWAFADASTAKDWTASDLGVATTNILRTYTPSNFAPAEERFSGSLVMNNSEMVMYLPLGKAYWARIRSVNNFGESSWEYVAVDNADSVTPGTGDKEFKGGAALETTGAANYAESINITKVTYNKNGGMNGTNLSDKIVYFVVDKAAIKDRSIIPFWAANGDPTNPLKKGNDKFVGWTSTGKTENTVYKAVYDGSTTGGTVYTDDPASTEKGKSTHDIKYVLTTAAAAMEAKWTGATPATTEADLEAADDGGYRGYECITLYADYTGSLVGQINYVDLAYDYRLATDWINLSKDGATPLTNGQGKTPKTLYESWQMDWSKSSGTQGKEIKMSVKFPANGAYNIGYVDTDNPGTDYTLKFKKKNTDTNFAYPVKITATVKDPYGAIKAVTTTTANNYNTQCDFDSTLDISNWENGSYTVYFNAVIVTSGKTITRSVSVTLNITD